MKGVPREAAGKTARAYGAVRADGDRATRRLLFVRRAKNEKPPTLLRLGFPFEAEQGTERPRICELAADLFGVDTPYPLRYWRDCSPRGTGV